MRYGHKEQKASKGHIEGCFGIGDVLRFQGAGKQQPDTAAYFLWLLSVIEKSDVKEDSIDTGCMLHYKVNPYVNRPTDGLTCWAAGMRFWGEGVENCCCLTGYDK